MLKIVYVRIQRYRSIMDLSFEVKADQNFISICGQNNVGKTNILRAINLFFYPTTYNQQTDMPNLKKATLGGSIYPKIELTFYDDKKDIFHYIVRDLRPTDAVSAGLSGCTFKGSIIRKREKTVLNTEVISDILSGVSFVYIESINTIVPQLIDNITQDVLSLEYDRARFTKNKRDLKEAYDIYVDGLQEILNRFSDDISTTFQEFRDNWNIEFHVPKNSDSFRDLISDDVTLQIKDKGSQGIDDKGSGLQRLAHILLEFEAASRITSKKSVILCIDEPDIYLHEGLQRKLKLFIDGKAAKMQIFCTTHSKVFIDTYRLRNTLLVSCNYTEQYVVRKSKNIDVIETILIDIDSDDGYRKICEHLGIEFEEYEVLQKNNILVEGVSDQKYLCELAKYFGIEPKNTISANGADNMRKCLDFYDSYYKEKERSGYMPVVKVLLDNDSKGREVYRKLRSKIYSNICTNVILLPNFSNNANLSPENNNTNNEIEDFVYPELVCFLINSLLEKKKMHRINEKSVCNKCNQKAFRESGILNICEYEKNSENPEKGSDISFVSSRLETSNVKEGLAGFLSIEGNRKLIDLIDKCDKKYPSVRNVLTEIFDFSALSITIEPEENAE